MLLVWKRNKYISGWREPLLHYFLFGNQVYFSGGLGSSLSLSSVEVNAKNYMCDRFSHIILILFRAARGQSHFRHAQGRVRRGINLSWCLRVWMPWSTQHMNEFKGLQLPENYNQGIFNICSVPVCRLAVKSLPFTVSTCLCFSKKVL